MNSPPRTTAARFVAALPAAALLVSVPVLAQTDPGASATGLLIHIERDSTYRNVARFEYNGPTAYVRIEAREPGSDPSGLPYTVDAPTLRAALAAIQIPAAKDPKVFLDAELDEIVMPLARALAKATAEQDVCFAVSGRHANYGILTPRSVTTARVFVKDGRLQLVFGLVHHDWDSAFKVNGTVAPFEPGHRAAPIKNEPAVAIGPEFGTSRRSDWIDLAPVSALAQAAPKPPAAAPGAPPAAAPAASDSDHRSYPAVSERLRTLQKLRDEGLITPQEYDAKRREILEQL